MCVELLVLSCVYKISLEQSRVEVCCVIIGMLGVGGGGGGLTILIRCKGPCRVMYFIALVLCAGVQVEVSVGEAESSPEGGA